MNSRAVVFAYHNVGVHCLSVLLAHGIDVQLVVTHTDNPNENIWFDSVAEVATLNGIPVITPEDPNVSDVVERVRAAECDFLFSFYYRHMLKPPLLTLPSRGALNMHGALLPKYRGRAPVNWAVIRGERETGASLHYMVEKPDAGDLVAQQAVPILPDDTAYQVFAKVTIAAEMVLDRWLPALIAGNAPRRPLDLAHGSYFGGRRPDDGRIDWTQPARAIHNLVRGVAPPYPGAFTDIGGHRLRLLRTHVETASASARQPQLYREDGQLRASCTDGAVLRIVDFEIDGTPADAARFSSIYGDQPLQLSQGSA